LLNLVLFLPGRAEAQGDGPGAQILFPVGTKLFLPTWLNMEVNSDFSQSVLNLDADVDADIFLAVYQGGFAIGDRFAEVWVVPIWGSLDATVDLTRPGAGAATRSVSTLGLGDAYAHSRSG
jgi:hypothetical protein